ncbi:nucleotidyl transferase AbiEii/AbiGii toxin family protein [uncultured Cellulomonas sp.]|uniref:nucleotidyl transferase AbiEii/AbiGii toxin family protein n=1 Tax=uncultured Cellulomonas sp. TaxID=189682 RepID=UPI0028E1A3EF|nr:nucleotidyl transferase AbiEii/AbiGii toxin family protein [uncultured Cellulomonas sp.]
MTEAAIYDVAERFGVDLDQVRRDHVISHILASISRRAQDRFIFYGGTALSRTWLPDARLSEDVDLMVIGRRRDGADALARAIDADIARPFLGASWSKDPRDARDAEDVTLTTGTGAVIKFQLVDTAGRPPWPTVRQPILQRYPDAQPATLVVPTPDAAVAMKMSAWFDRRAERDLFDLWAMATRGLITPGALALYRQYGPSSRPPSPSVFQPAPSETAWRASLGHQTLLDVTAADAAEVVAAAWTSLGADL